VYQTKIDQNTAQITQLNQQLGNLSSTQNTILEKGKVNSRLLRSVDAKDRQVSQLNKKIEGLQTENAKNTEKINEIKLQNLDLEKEVGGFRFVAEAFGMELKNVVKFFIFLIVIVFDPLAVALIIAFNGLIGVKKKNREELLSEMAENNQKMGLYEIYGDKNEVIEENISNENEKNEINTKNEEKSIESGDSLDDVTSNNEFIEEELPNLQWEEYMHPEFPWQKRNLWINNPKAVKYWLSSKKGTEKELSKLINEENNTKTY